MLSKSTSALVLFGLTITSLNDIGQSISNDNGLICFVQAEVSHKLLHSWRVNGGDTINHVLKQFSQQLLEAQIVEREQQIRQEEKQRKEREQIVQEIEKKLIAKVYPEKWFPQTFDHFKSPPSPVTWRQRYFSNVDFYKSGGPVFLMIGGEGEISGEYVGSKFFAYYMAQKWNGAMYALEHRFYGKSQPKNGNNDDLTLLSSRQALADLAQFVRVLKKEQYPDAPFLCLGGSYPGNLAAWFRQLYPDLVVGCLSFSAPVYAKVDFYEYGQMVLHAIGEGPGTKLLSGYQTIFQELKGGTLNMRKEILKRLNACDYSVLSTGDLANVDSALSGATAGVVQYNNTLPLGQKIEDLVKMIEDAPSAEDAAWAVTRKLVPGVDDPSSSLGDGTNNGDNCISYSTRDSYQTFSSPGFGSARSWVWQTCNEFGYFQTSRVSRLNKTMYTPGVSDTSLWDDLCLEVFGVEDVASRVTRTRAFYDTDKVSRTIFVNGELDPWMTLGRGVYSDPSNDHYGFQVPHGSHCVGLYGDPDSPAVMKAAKETQRQILEIVEKWLFPEKVHSKKNLSSTSTKKMSTISSSPNKENDKITNGTTTSKNVKTTTSSASSNSSTSASSNSSTSSTRVGGLGQVGIRGGGSQLNNKNNEHGGSSEININDQPHNEIPISGTSNSFTSSSLRGTGSGSKNNNIDNVEVIDVDPGYDVLE